MSGRDSKAGREVGKLYSEEKNSTYAPIGGCWHGEAGSRLSSSERSDLIGLEGTYDFLWLVPSWTWGRKIGKLVITVQVLALLR